MITAAPIDGPRWLLADWLELEVLCAPVGRASVHTINSDPAADRDSEPDELDEDDLRNERRLSRLVTEIDQRRKCLKGSYPFEFSGDGTMLTRTKSGYGPSVYLFCLLASHGRSGGFLHNEDIVEINDVPDLMQACATWSAAGYEQGPSYALGIDPSSKAFLPRLAEIYGAFGDGTPVAQIPKGAPPHVKDDGIDVVAWRQMPDDRPPADYLMAQVASGHNWTTKSVKTAIGRFLATWFAPQPARTPKPALMIPYCIEPTDDDDEDSEQEALAMQWRRLVAEFGELFYRYQLPHFAALGLQLRNAGIHVDMADWLARLDAFVDSAILRLQTGSR